MRTLTLALVAATLSATAALAQSPSVYGGASDRIVPLAGTSDGGVIDHPPVYGAYRDAEGRVDVDDTGSVRGGSFISNRAAVFEDSAKGGNAEQNQRSYPNLGTTSGGPEF
ncbi:hypothetical protein [Methylobacterium sp. E-045]|jgi:hypothetical protein|uniref:hypothetical protein n=1 Tax=Methylobacterium sp. E-045 TaxID=2836575 RepID=UPI001FB93869|nr:hypothetical protein [Methylobacterium sp. E-045]MCJ2132147.1 hypothetical protein [Methylobacterium sp. E-045]